MYLERVFVDSADEPSAPTSQLTNDSV